MSILEKLQNFKPLSEYHSGHTPLQIEHFKVSSQRGSPYFEYWQHVIQLKHLKNSLIELQFEVEECRLELESAAKWWKLGKRQKLKAKKLEHRLKNLLESFKDKELEAQRHFDIVESKYSAFKDLPEIEILAHEQDYWVARLSRQMAFSSIAVRTGLNAGDLAAVASLPEEVQAQIMLSAQKIARDYLQLGEGKNNGESSVRLPKSSEI